MSSSRANASAINRRTNGSGAPQQQVKPPGSNNGPRQTQNTKQITQNQQENTPTPKLSLQQAIGLSSLRISRIESILENLPNFDELTIQSDPNQSIPENMRVVDEAVFTNIVSRLEKLEQNHLLSQKQNELNIKKVQTNYLGLTKTVEGIKFEISELKEKFESLQKFVIESTKIDETDENQEIENFNEIQQSVEDLESSDKQNEYKEDLNESNEIITNDLKQTIENEINSTI